MKLNRQAVTAASVSALSRFMLFDSLCENNDYFRLIETGLGPMSFDCKRKTKRQIKLYLNIYVCIYQKQMQSCIIVLPTGHSVNYFLTSI